MISIQKFYNRFNRNSPENKDRGNGDIDAKFLLRDLSLFPAYLLAKKKIKAKTVTILFLATCLLANLVFIKVGILPLLISFLLYEFAQLLDCIDGQLARYYGTFSERGKLLDHLFHEIISSSFMGIFAVKLYLSTQNLAYLVLGFIVLYSFAFNELWDETFNKIEPESENELGIAGSVFIKAINPFLREPRYLIFLFITIYPIQKLIANIQIDQIVFVGITIFNFVDKIVYRIYKIYVNSDKGTVNKWKGWH